MTYYLHESVEPITKIPTQSIISILADGGLETWTHDPDNPREDLAEWLEAGNTLEPWDHELNPARHNG